MKLLAIDTSTTHTSIAVGTHQRIYSETVIGTQQQSYAILPLIQKCLKNADMTLENLDGIVFGAGPGSFTGLRVACSVAKGLAVGAELPLYAVTSMQAIAFGLMQFPVLTILDARMKQVYWSYYQTQAVLLRSVQPEIQVSAPEDVSIPEKCLLAGVDFDAYLPFLPPTTEQHLIYPTAEAMIKCVQMGGVKPVNVTDALPIYIRGAVSG